MLFRCVPFLLFLFLQNPVFCQRSFAGNDVISQNHLNVESKLSGEAFIQDYTYVGSPYFIDNWIKGEVTLKTGQIVHNKWIRYEGLHDDLIWRNDSSFQEVKLDKNLISEFVLGQSAGSGKYYFRKIRIPSWIKNDTIEVFAQTMVNTDAISLYAIRRVIIEGHVAREASGHIILKQLLSPDPYYYLIIHGKPGLRARKLNRRAILSMFPEIADQIKSLLKEHNNKLRTDDELVEMAKLINNFLNKK